MRGVLHKGRAESYVSNKDKDLVELYLSKIHMNKIDLSWARGYICIVYVYLTA